MMRFLLFFLLLPIIGFSQNELLDSVFKDSGECYFSFELANMNLVSEYDKVISIDKISEDQTIFAYANRKEFGVFLEKNIDYKILPKPSNRIQPKMLTVADWEVMKNMDCNNPWDAYPTYDAYEMMMQNYVTEYPDLCELIEFGTLTSGRKLLMLKISDNVSVEENEPKFLYTGTMHGDETAGYVLLMHYIDHLLCNYNSDPELTELVNEIEIYINPLANPNGTYTNDDSTVNGAIRGNGVITDLNRNYPDPEDGPHPDGEDYAPETEAFMAFHDATPIDLSANFHGGAEVVNYPWDTWETLHADDNWWQLVSFEYADSCQANSPSGYMTDFGSGVTNGYQWYSIAGGRQDYVNYFKYGREVTLEISDQKLLDEDELVAHWEYNYRSIVNFTQQALYGVRGVVTDSITGAPLVAKAFIEGHDFNNSEAYSRLPHGNYHRFLKAGFYDITYSADGYVPKTVNVLAIDHATQIVDVQLAQQESVNVEYLKNQPSINIFPNPVETTLHFSISNFGQKEITVRLYDVLGKVVFNQVFSATDADHQININGLPSGTYILEASNLTTKVFQKVLIK